MDARFSALAAKVDRLQQVSRWLFRGALVLLALAVMLWWPDPAGRDLFGDYVSVPSPLDHQLSEAGAAIRLQPAWLLNNGGSGFQFGLLILFFIPGHILIQRLRSRVAKHFAYLATPLWLLMPLAALSSSVSGPEVRVSAARTGILVERPDAPPAAADGTNRPPVPAYHLRPSVFTPVAADQARYVLAQQAYIDDRPARAAAHLRGLTGAWRPADMHASQRIGMLARWTAAHGFEAGAIAADIGGGGPPASLRRLLTLLVLIIAAAGAASAIVLDIVGTSRRRSSTKLKARSAGLPVERERPSAAGGFGRRVVAGAAS